MAHNNRTGRGVALPSLSMVGGSAGMRSGDNANTASSAAAAPLSITGGTRNSGKGAKLPSTNSSSVELGGRPSRTPRRGQAAAESNTTTTRRPHAMPAIDETTSGVGVIAGMASSSRHIAAPPPPAVQAPLARQKTLPVLTNSNMTTTGTAQPFRGGNRSEFPPDTTSSSFGHGTARHERERGIVLPSITSHRQSSNAQQHHHHHQQQQQQHQSSRTSGMATVGRSTQNSFTEELMQQQQQRARHAGSSNILPDTTNGVQRQSNNTTAAMLQRMKSDESDLFVAGANTELLHDRQAQLKGQYDVAGWSEIGAKPENQDVFDIQRLSSDELYVSVLDGHGPTGGDVAKHGTKLLYSRIAQAARDEAMFGPPPLDPLNGVGGGAAAAMMGGRKQILRSACLQTHKSLCDNASFSTLNSGSTVTIAILRHNQLTMAWLGDSRSVIGREDRKTGKLRAAQLTRDHNCDDMVEAARIRRSGGKVQQYYYCGRFVGPKRIWLKEQGQRTPGLMVSRSVGDEIAHSVGCIADPEMLEMDLTARDKVLIVASDGVWDGISNQKAVDIAWGCATAAEASRAVVDAALDGLHRHGLADNVTAVVTFLPGPMSSAKLLVTGRGQNS